MSKLKISGGFGLAPAKREDNRQFILDTLDFYKSVGFDAIDVGTNLVITESDETLEEFRAHADEIGLPFSAAHLPYGIAPTSSVTAKEDFANKVYRGIDALTRLGVKTAVMHPISPSNIAYKFEEQKEFERDVKFLEPFVEYARQRGIEVVIENMRLGIEVYRQYPGYMPLARNCHTPEQLCRVVDALGVGVCYDFGHANINGLNVGDALRYIGKRLKLLHVNDNFGYGDDHIGIYFGQVKWHDAAKALGEIGYDGLFNLEIGAGRLPMAARRTYAEYLVAAARSIVDEIE